MKMGLAIQVEEVGGKTLMRLTGRVDAVTAPQLEKRLDALFKERHHGLLIDFSEIEYLSSAGLRVLFAFHKKCKEKKGAMALFGLQDEVFEVVRMAGFDKIFSLFESEQEALRS
jgi:anti-sigma B factor antagonist/stage II sporulation protein AA (anti-sigma F factor antagonist)